MATINHVPVTFLLDTESALTILRKDTWDQSRRPDECLTPWNELNLGGAEGTTLLTVHGSALVQWEANGKAFVQTVLVVDPVTTEATLGLDFLSSCNVDLVKHMSIAGDGHVITLCSQSNNSRKTVPALPVRVVANVRIPSYSKMEIMADVTGSYKDNQVYVL